MSSKYPVLSEALTKRYALPEADADKFVAQMFDVLLKAVEQEGVVKVKGLGTFKLTPVGARESVDVNTGERIVIDSRNKITFVPDVVLRDRVNSPFAQFETVVLNDGVEFSSLDEKPEDEEEIEETDENEATEENEAAKREETADAEAANAEENEADAEEEADAENEADAEEEADAEDEADAEEETADEENDADEEEEDPAEGKAPAEEEAPAEDKSPAEGSVKEDPPTPIHVVADKLTDASDKLSSASSKLSDVSDKLSSASERLSDSSKQLSTASSQAADGSGSSQLRDALAIANDLRKQVFDMKQQSFTYTNENRKLKNANFMLLKRVRRMRLWLWVLALSVVVLLAAIGVGCYYIASEPTPIILQERSAFEAEQDSLAVKKGQTAPADASQGSASQADASQATVPQASSPQATVPQGSSPQGAAPQGTAQQRSSSAPSEPKTAKPAANRPANRPAPAANPSAAAHGSSTAGHGPSAAAQPKGSQPSTAQTSSYDSDPRVRTGAYRITGVAQVVVARKGQTLASISRAYLGEGMECYVEALNGKEVTEGTKVKIPKLELKKKSKRK